MALSMVKKLVELKRKKWQSKIQHTKGNVLAILGRVLLVCRKKQENANPRCIIKIPDDLVEEILHRLPVKSLVRLKSVSKEWKSMIESGYLAEKHLRLLEKKYGVYEEMQITVQKSTSQSLCIKFFSKSGTMSCGASSEGLLRVPGSCNGLVCVHAFDAVNVYLCNPMTGVVRTLTPPPPQGNNEKLSVGFGIDVVTGTYKVVLLYGLGPVVFDFGTSKWRPTAGPMPLSCIPRPDRNPVFVNGSLFWLLASDFSEILVMDLHTEKFRTLSTPNEMDVSLGDIYMCSLEDRVCIFNFRHVFSFSFAVGVRSYVWVLVKDELSERWERTTYKLLGIRRPPISLNSAWFSQTLVSPCQSSSSTCIGYRQRQSSSASAQCQ
ncbi:F-box domain-containing protein [Hirschfeldia incana]|nr:F-box domain-containing protein [Hirschfeldia incana]